MHWIDENISIKNICEKVKIFLHEMYVCTSTFLVKCLALSIAEQLHTITKYVLNKTFLGHCIYFSFSTHQLCIFSLLYLHDSIAMASIKPYVYPDGIRTRVFGF
jgi:hypothetical protein